MNISTKNKIYIFLVICTIVLVLAFIFPFKSRLNSLDFKIIDSNNNNLYETNESLTLKLNDSTLVQDKKGVWFFGNNDSIKSNKNVKYIFRKPGKYLITFKIDDDFEIAKKINIVDGYGLTAKDSIPRLFCEDFGYVGEEMVFSSYAPGSTKFYWQFGETGTIDAYEKQAVYVFNKPGNYTVKLETDKTKYPITRDIVIYKMYEEFKEPEKIDSTNIITNDIKKRLQMIANLDVSNKKGFNDQVNYLRKRYFCRQLSDIVVIVNEEKYNDFLSYCQGLHYLSGKSIVIQDIKLDTIKCFKEIKVTQNEKTKK